jgi:hypothetical protein
MKALRSLFVKALLMQTSKRFSLLFAAILGLTVYGTGYQVEAVLREWEGPGTDPTVPANWVGDVAPTTGDEARFSNLVGAPTTVTIPAGGFNPRYIGFSGTGDVLGVIPNYTFDGTGKITIGTNSSAGNIDTFRGQTGTVTFNNTGGIDLMRTSPLYGASDTSGTSNLVISAGTPLRVGVGTGSGADVAFNAWGSNITINSTAGVDYSGSGVIRRLVLNAFAGKTTALNTGVVDTAQLSRITATGQAGGKIFLGVSPTQATWAGQVVINNSDLIIAHNDTLGVVGSISGPASYTSTGAGTSVGALVLTNNITSGESIFLGQRTTDAFPNIKNQSGHNILTGTNGADGTGTGTQTDQNYIL